MEYVTTQETVDSIKNERAWNWIIAVAAVISLVVSVNNIRESNKKLSQAE